MKVHIASSRPIGVRCERWARHTYVDFQFVKDMEEADVSISVMYDKLLTEEYINRPGRRCYNFHPGILPQYRGSGAFSWAIINGETRAGVTLHAIDVNIDTGPIIEVRDFPIRDTDTAGDLFDTAMVVMETMFRDWFLRLVVDAGCWAVVPQDESKAKTYYRKHLQAARDITRIVRAFTFDGKPPAFYVNRQGEKVEVRW